MLRGEIRRVQKLMRLTALFVTHDQLEALAMSDRIMVMNDGVLQQIGSPEEICDTPENLFVAGFVGEPAMNTFPVARVRDGGADLVSIAGQRVALADLGLAAVPDRPELIIGIRPKNLVLGKAGSPGRLQGRVHTFEVLGDFTLASISLGSGDLVFKIGDAGLRLGVDDPVSLSFEPEKVLFYDARTSLRIRAGV
jgi:ABC-type sugar transport system ATPase subunit